MFTVPLTSLQLAAVAVLRLSGHLPSEGCSSYSTASTLGYTPNKEGESLETGTTGQVTLRGKGRDDGRSLFVLSILCKMHGGMEPE